MFRKANDNVGVAARRRHWRCPALAARLDGERPQALANEVTGEVYAIDVLGLTNNAKELPAQQYAAH